MSVMELAAGEALAADIAEMRLGTEHGTTASGAAALLRAEPPTAAAASATVAATRNRRLPMIPRTGPPEVCCADTLTVHSEPAS
jgi:hypothetical protein